MSAFPHLRPKHVEVFKRACRRFHVAILVRQTNTKSLRFIGEPYATAKRIDVKAKTADNPFSLRAEHVTDAPGAALVARSGRLSGPLRPVRPAAGQERDVAGLVVDPNIVGRGAFRGGKWAAVEEAWNDFKPYLPPDMATLEAQNKRFTDAKWIHGYSYFVERDPWDPFFGCVKDAKGGLINAQRVIHGDFDLYAIIDMTDPAANVRVVEKLAKQDHTRSRKFMDVQNFINGSQGLGVPMVLHGAQETFKDEHTDEGLDCFFPDGRAFSVSGRRAIEQLYRHQFKGRLLFTDKGEELFGKWRQATS